jgi:hypothetical protein
MNQGKRSASHASLLLSRLWRYRHLACTCCRCSRHSFCALNSPGEGEVARRISQKLCKKLAKAKIGSFACPFSDPHDSTDVTYSESETDVVDPGDDEDLVLRRLDASFSPKRMKGLLGSGLASKFASLRTFARGDDLSQLTLETSAGEESGSVFAADEEFEPADPGWLHPYQSTSIRPPFRITPQKYVALTVSRSSRFRQSGTDLLSTYKLPRCCATFYLTRIRAAKRKMAIRAAQKAARDVGASSSVLR